MVNDMRPTLLQAGMWTMMLAAVAAVSACGPAPLQEPPPPREVVKKDPARIEPVNPALLGYDFWRHWSDGMAEVNSYDLTFPRYGQLRQGVAVAVFVTETFTNAQRVKHEEKEPDRQDLFPVMKLNLIESYRTGVYTYNEMLSSFVALTGVNLLPPGAPTKVSFSSQEWCGHVYHQLLFGPEKVRSTQHSYFDGEGDRNLELDIPDGSASEDTLWHWARGFGHPLMESGERAEVTLLPALQRVRHGHLDLAWAKATLKRGDPTQILAPAGKFDVEVVIAEIEGGPTRTFYVERASPRRIIRWETSDGERAELVASKRMKYWEIQGTEALLTLKDLGLQSRPPRTP